MSVEKVNEWLEWFWTRRIVRIVFRIGIAVHLLIAVLEAGVKGDYSEAAKHVFFACVIIGMIALFPLASSRSLNKGER